MTEVIMPKMGDGMEEGTLLEWVKQDGESVKSGETIAMIQTDKASLEMEAPATGVLTGLLIHEGETVPVGVAIALVLKPGETKPDTWGSNGSSKTSATAGEATPKSVSVSAETSDKHEPISKGSRVKASPLAKRIAAELGVDLSEVVGSGPGGRITENDVRSRPSTPKPSLAVAATGTDTLVPLNKIRQITAKRTAESKTTVPHFYATVEVDLEAILQLREMFAAGEEFKPSINDFVVKAVALALRAQPHVNSSFQGDSLLVYGAVNIGMAVALDDGLTVPVIRNADRLSLREISTKSKDLASKARENRLGLEELSGSTFAVSNMGMLNVVDFGAIINQPNAGIIAVASARRVVVPTDQDDEVEIRTRMNLTGSFDHRVVDGAIGAKFMNLVRELLESPTRLLN